MTVAVAVVPDAIVTSPGRMVLTWTLSLPPAVGSVMLQTVPAGMSLKVSDVVPVVSAGTLKVNW